jgi:small-conductance mechanosensitive channel
MEENDIIDDQVLADNNLLTSLALDHLKEMRKWTNFLAIVGFILSGIIIVFGLFAGTLFQSLNELSVTPFPMGLLGLIYIAMGVLYLIPAYQLYKFSQQMKLALESKQSDFFTTSFNHLRKMFKFLGILMVIVLSLYAVMFLFGLIFGGLAALS